MSKTIFERILAGEIPVRVVFENEHVLAFEDVSPQAPVHVLVIPKQKIVNIAAAQATQRDVLGEIILAAQEVARIEKIDQSGFRLVFNSGADGGQTVDYLHCHVLGGRSFSWPPG